MNKILTALLAFFYRFFQNHQKEIEVLMLRIIEAIAEDVIRRKKQKSKSQEEAFDGTHNENAKVEQSPLS